MTTAIRQLMRNLRQRLFCNVGFKWCPLSTTCFSFCLHPVETNYSPVALTLGLEPRHRDTRLLSPQRGDPLPVRVMQAYKVGGEIRTHAPKGRTVLRTGVLDHLTTPTYDASRIRTQIPLRRWRFSGPLLYQLSQRAIQPLRDSNPYRQSQSLLCYHYTKGQ